MIKYSSNENASNQKSSNKYHAKIKSLDVDDVDFEVNKSHE